MRATAVSSQQVIKYGRMDAKFHILVAEFGERASALEAQFSADEIMGLFASLTLADIARLEPLMRGPKVVNYANIVSAAAEYPHIALAILEPHLNAGIRLRVDGQIAQATNTAGVLDEWTAQLQLGPGRLPER